MKKIIFFAAITFNLIIGSSFANANPLCMSHEVVLKNDAGFKIHVLVFNDYNEHFLLEPGKERRILFHPKQGNLDVGLLMHDAESYSMRRNAEFAFVQKGGATGCASTVVTRMSRKNTQVKATIDPNNMTGSSSSTSVSVLKF